MAGILVTYARQASASAPAAAPRAEAAARASASSEQLREQIKQTIRDAQIAARDAQQAAREGGHPVVIPPVPPVPPSFPGYTIHDGFDASNVIPPQAVDIAIGFFVMCAVIIVGWPIARAFGRRIERRGEVATMPAAVTDQLLRIEQAVDAMAIEVERISESQRFMAKLQNAAGSERMALPHERG